MCKALYKTIVEITIAKKISRSLVYCAEKSLISGLSFGLLVFYRLLFCTYKINLFFLKMALV